MSRLACDTRSFHLSFIEAGGDGLHSTLNAAEKQLVCEESRLRLAHLSLYISSCLLQSCRLVRLPPQSTIALFVG